MTRRGCGCCEAATCDLFSIGANTDPTGSGFSTNYVGSYPTSSSGVVIPANSYLQWDTSLPITGFEVSTNGTQGPAVKLSNDIEIVIVNSMDVEVAAIRRIDGQTVRIVADGGSTDFELIQDSFGTAGTTFAPVYSLFHKLVVTHLAVQCSRLSAKDPFYFYGTTLTWDDGTDRSRLTGTDFALSRRSSNLVSGCNVRLVNTSGSNITVEHFTAIKRSDDIEPLAATCDDARQVCLVIKDNHVQKWDVDTAGFSWEGFGIRNAAIEESQNCVYVEESDYGTIDDNPPNYKSLGTIGREYYIDQYNYSKGQLQLHSPKTSLVYSEPDDPSSLDSFYRCSITPKAHGSDPSKVLLDVDFFMYVPGLIYDGTQPGPSNISITTPGSQITATVINEIVDSSSYNVSLLSSAPGSAGQSFIGFCRKSGVDVTFGTTDIDAFYTSSWSSTTRQTWEFEDNVGLYWADGLELRFQWNDVEATKWSGSSPTLNLTSNDADITVNSTALATIGEDDVYMYKSGSTTLNSSDAPFDFDQYTPFTANNVGSFEGEIVGGSGTCPINTGDSDVSYKVTTDAVFERVDWDSLSLTITGSS